MSFFGNIGHAITKGVSDAGHFVGKVADNPIAKTLTAAALAATGVGVPASAAIMGTMAGGGVSLADRLKNMAMSAGSSLVGGGGGTGGGGGGTSLLDKLLMGGTVAAGAVDEAQKRGLQNKAADYATGPYDARAGLRAKALTALENPPPVDPRIAAASADPGNVYDRARRARMLATATTGGVGAPGAAPGTAPTTVPGTPAPMGLSAILAHFGKPSPAPVLA